MILKASWWTNVTWLKGGSKTSSNACTAMPSNKVTLNQFWTDSKYRYKTGMFFSVLWWLSVPSRIHWTSKCYFGKETKQRIVLQFFFWYFRILNWFSSTIQIRRFPSLLLKLGRLYVGRPILRRIFSIFTRANDFVVTIPSCHDNERTSRHRWPSSLQNVTSVDMLGLFVIAIRFQHRCTVLVVLVDDHRIRNVVAYILQWLHQSHQLLQLTTDFRKCHFSRRKCLRVIQLTDP